MKVSELVGFLKTMPQDSDVVLSTSYHEKEAHFSPLIDMSLRKYEGDHKIGSLNAWRHGTDQKEMVVLWPNLTDFDIQEYNQRMENLRE